MARSRSAPQRPPNAAADAWSHLADLDLAALRQDWRRRLRRPPPAIRSADVLARLLAWHIQAAQSGDLDPLTRQALALRTPPRSRRALGPGHTIQMADSQTISSGGTVPPARPALRAGDILVRVWNGNEHRVLVLDNGFDYRGGRYRSLSEIARLITGSRWSGPRFFGLEPPTARPPSGGSACISPLSTRPVVGPSNGAAS